MQEIDYFEIVVSRYHDEIVARIQFANGDKLEQSALYSLAEINNILMLWKMGELMGSFAMNCKLSEKFRFQIFEG